MQFKFHFLTFIIFIPAFTELAIGYLYIISFCLLQNYKNIDNPQLFHWSI